jgi:crotonobetainyl-CoA:carnitine CoA-transferase CaiB-like acyl-CoA transferase
LLGQHTREVFAELGLDDARLAALEEAGVVAPAET